MVGCLRPFLVADEGAITFQQEIPGTPCFDVLPCKTEGNTGGGAGVFGEGPLVGGSRFRDGKLNGRRTHHRWNIKRMFFFRLFLGAASEKFLQKAAGCSNLGEV